MRRSLVALTFLCIGSLCFGEGREASYSVASAEGTAQGFWSRMSRRVSKDASVIDPGLMVRSQPLSMGEFAQEMSLAGKVLPLSIGKLTIQPVSTFFENNEAGVRSDLVL